MNPVRRSIAGIAAAALTATGLSVLTVASAPSAHAEEVSIDDATFRWELNKESTGPSYFGGGNFFSAGRLGNPGEGNQLLNNADQGATWANTGRVDLTPDVRRVVLVVAAVCSSANGT